MSGEAHLFFQCALALSEGTNDHWWPLSKSDCVWETGLAVAAQQQQHRLDEHTHTHTCKHYKWLIQLLIMKKVGDGSVHWPISSAPHPSLSLKSLHPLHTSTSHTLTCTHTVCGSHSELMLLASQLSLCSVLLPQARLAREQQAAESVCVVVLSAIVITDYFGH